MARTTTDLRVRVDSDWRWDLDNRPAPQQPTNVRASRAPDGDTYHLSVECADAALAEATVRERAAQIYAKWEGATT